MKVGKTRATLAVCSAVLTLVGGATMARPRHHATHRHVAGPVAHATGADRDMRYPFLRAQASHARHAPTRARAAGRHAHAVTGGFTSNALVADARRYLGTNPTGRPSLWCGAFMDKVLRDTGHKGGGNLALGYLHYGHRVSGPQVGAIAVMRRRGGGHVGVVSGIDANGNPIIVSGNHNHTVAESVYPRSRIAAYVVP
ncbi:MAG: TIGR02594 family protein [Pseudolabrys sp.]